MVYTLLFLTLNVRIKKLNKSSQFLYYNLRVCLNQARILGFCMKQRDVYDFIYLYFINFFLPSIGNVMFIELIKLNDFLKNPYPGLKI